MRLLFRPEAVEAHRQQWLGRVQLVHPLSLSLITTGIVAIDRFNGTDTGAMIWDAIERRVAARASA